MIRPTFFAVLLFFFALSADAGIIDDREVTVSSIEHANLKRQSLRNYVWGPQGFPYDKLPDLPAIIGDKSPVRDLTGLARVDTLTVTMANGVKSYSHHFIPQAPNRHLVVLHLGHSLSFDDDPQDADVGFGMRRTIQALLTEGYSVLAVYMPRSVHFETTITVFDDAGAKAHNDFFNLPEWDPPQGSPLQYFVEPIAAFINYLEAYDKADSFPDYYQYSFIGFSGGGWTAAVYSAMDTRISLTFDIAGSLPLYSRGINSFGDAEQNLANFYHIAGYPDLYLLASLGHGRRMVQTLIRRDDCCFSEEEHEPDRTDGLDWIEAIRDYEARIRSRQMELGDNDLFRLEIDEAADGHMVSWDAIFDTILPELNRARRSIGAFDITEAFVRGGDGSLGMNSLGNWARVKNSGMVGTPAALKGSVFLRDIFYRTEANRLVHRARQPFAWTREKIIAEHILSDPSAVSSGPGRWDVIAQRRDYYLYHFSLDANGVTSTLISGIKALGAPSAVSSGDGKIAVFYRGWDRSLYCAKKDGDGPWTVEFVGGLMTADPAGIMLADGTLRAYVRGLSGDLWQASETAKGWERNSLSAVTGSGPITGRPSVSMINGNLAIFARMPNGNAGLYMFGDNWYFANIGNTLSVSPTAAPGGAFIRDHFGRLWRFDGADWQYLGGNFDQ